MKIVSYSVSKKLLRPFPRVYIMPGPWVSELRYCTHLKILLIYSSGCCFPSQISLNATRKCSLRKVLLISVEPNTKRKYHIKLYQEYTYYAGLLRDWRCISLVLITSTINVRLVTRLLTSWTWTRGNLVRLLLLCGSASCFAASDQRLLLLRTTTVAASARVL